MYVSPSSPIQSCPSGFPSVHVGVPSTVGFTFVVIPTAMCGCVWSAIAFSRTRKYT